jgi:hypothetical protein
MGRRVSDSFLSKPTVQLVQGLPSSLILGTLPKEHVVRLPSPLLDIP